jgi:hypothetical protein
MSARMLTLAAVTLGGAAAALLSPVAASATTAPSAAATACDRAPWEAKVQGAPSGLSAGSRSGDYLWHDTTGFHLRVTHGGTHDQRVYTGAVSSTARLRIDPARLEKGDTLTLSSDHHTLTFAFANHGYLDGVNFHTYFAARLTVSRLHVGSRNLPAGQVYLGHTKAHPGAVPFSVHRI